MGLSRIYHSCYDLRLRSSRGFKFPVGLFFLSFFFFTTLPLRPSVLLFDYHTSTVLSSFKIVPMSQQYIVLLTGH